MNKKIEKYFSKNTYYNTLSSFLMGLGLGVMVSRPWAGAHPLRYGLLFLVIGIAMYLYPMVMGKK